MKTKSLPIAAALLGGLLSLGAASNDPAANDQLARPKSEVPVPSKVVQPTDLPRSFMGATVRVVLTVDASGRPHDIKVTSVKDSRLRDSLIAALSQWEFTPALKDGRPVATTIEMPIVLAGS